MPNNENIHEHPYYINEELVAKLKKEGLIMINKSQFIYYLGTFNYHNIVNKYKACFLIRNQYRHFLRNPKFANVGWFLQF